MKKSFSKAWKSSKQPRKQRKYLAKAPLHLKNKLLKAHLSSELRKKYGTRSARIRVGDKVKVLRGSFKNKEGNIEKINPLKARVYLSKMEITKMDGSKKQPSIKVSNVMIIDLKIDDKKRLKRFVKPKKLVKETKKELKVKKVEKDIKTDVKKNKEMKGN